MGEYVLKLLVVFLLTSVLIGCGVEVNGSASVFASSGSMHDQYVEEPIATDYRKYESALLLSNKLTGLIEKGDYAAVYGDYSSVEFKSSVGLQEFKKTMEGLMADAGQIEEFKHMQWYFRVYKKGGRALLLSTKIVKHKGLMVSYNFLFEQGRYDEIVGLTFSNYKPLKAAG